MSLLEVKESVCEAYYLFISLYDSKVQLLSFSFKIIIEDTDKVQRIQHAKHIFEHCYISLDVSFFNTLLKNIYNVLCN